MRHATHGFPVASGRPRAGKRLLTVGSDCESGKMYASLALDGSGRARIASYDATGGNLTYAGWSGSLWLIGTVDTGGTNDVGKYASLAVNSAGLMRIAYQDDTADDLFLISEQP